MIYKLRNKKFISILGFILISFGILLTTFLVKNGNLFQTNAGPSSQPKNIKITNISDTSFTVSYLTDASAIGTINFSKDSALLDQVVLDERDQISQKINSYKSHSINVNSLEPNTTYYFTITSASEVIKNNGSPFIVKTGPAITAVPTSQNPISGRVLNPDGSTPTEGLVYLNTNNGQVLSTIIKKDGTYLLPLNTIRTADLNNYLILNQYSILNLEVSSSNLISKIDISPNQTSPVPVVTLSNSYDFYEDNPEPTPTIRKTVTNRKFPEMETKIKKSQ